MPTVPEILSRFLHRFTEVDIVQQKDDQKQHFHGTESDFCLKFKHESGSNVV